ncbi:LutC/YkgG family protein [Limisalsivibrio acetivorans]|uniref:LutC/YkgG family protein n=1 Tax=Limisalsivibrio acetivorans TaxID=1304888 RepID=UPI0003B489BC|nr:LUD domain-containing protein [Limisalsivibrio acetivorans]
MNDTSVLERFIHFSEMVSNENVLVTSEELKQKIEELKPSYANIPLIGITETNTEITEAGIEAAVVEADYAIGETGSVVVNSWDEKLRMATCLAEHLYAVVPESRIVMTLDEIEEYMTEKNKNPYSYIAFITGASRTADIERVLTIGVHGPVKMTVFIVKGV